jgi:hypothetical protein
MPRFFFDLLIDSRLLPDPGGMPFPSCVAATAVADKLARYLTLNRAELCNGSNCVRVRNERGEEVCRCPIDTSASTGRGCKAPRDCSSAD